MLSASARASLTKTLGSTHFTDTLFATSLDELTPAAYAAHKAHATAPKPLSPREREMADVQAAQREAEEAYQGHRARVNHGGAPVGLKWSEEVEDAVRALAEADGGNRLVVIVRSPPPPSFWPHSLMCWIYSTETILGHRRCVGDV